MIYLKSIEELYPVDKGKLSDAIVWMRLLLGRTDTVPSPEKEQIEKRLSMYDDLWDNNPIVQKQREQDIAEGLQKGRQEGRQEGFREGLQFSLVNAVRVRFPDLAEFAQYQASHFDQPDVLESLIQQVMVAPDATAVVKLLRSEANTSR